MKKVFSSIAIALGLLVLPAAIALADNTATVNIADDSFSPATLSVTAGTMVTWTNTGTMGHTVTADSGLFDSGNLASGATYSYTFSTPGTFAYYCKYHGGPGGVGMSGTITVMAASTNSTTATATTTATTTMLTLPGASDSSATSTATSTPGLSFTGGLEFQNEPETPGAMPNTTVDANGVMAIVQYPDGPRLIQLQGDTTVYWVSPSDLKIPMLNRAVFLSYNNKDSDVQTVAQDEFDYYQDAQYIRLNGSGAIYKIDISTGTKRQITSSAWSASGLDASVIVDVNKTDLNSYKTEAQITDPSDLQNSVAAVPPVTGL